MRLRIIHVSQFIWRLRFFRDQTDYVTTITDIYFSKYQTEHQVNSNKEHQEIGSLKNVCQ